MTESNNRRVRWVRRNVFLIVSIMLFAVSCVMFEAVNWSSHKASVPIVGGAIYYESGRAPTEKPTYVLADYKGKLFLDAQFKAIAGQDLYLSMAGADIGQRTYSNADPLQTPPITVSMNFPTLPLSVVPTTFRYLHVMPTGTNVVINCIVNVSPLQETYTTSTIDFIPLGSRYLKTSDAGNYQYEAIGIGPIMKPAIIVEVG